MNNFKNLTVSLAVILVLIVFSSAYTVDETKQVVITQFGKPVGQPVKTAGLHFKLPFIQTANFFEKRILEWNGYPNEIPTRDKKFIWVDTTARWKIVAPLLFMQSMGTENHARTRLDDIIDGMTRDLITSQGLNDVVRNSNRILTLQKADEDVTTDEQLESIEIGRDQITRAILEKAKAIVSDYGIELVDVRIRRLGYVDRVRQKVYERMISERKRAAEKLRSEGQGIKAGVEGQKEKELKRIQSEAYRKAQEIKGQADAEATDIYASAYSKDPDFFEFLKTLELYPETLKGSYFIMSTEADYLRFLRAKGSEKSS